MSASPAGPLLTDKFGRFHDYLRISLTDSCNLRCQYCMPEEDMHFMKRENLMTADEINTLAGLFVQHGVRKIRLTGGEPLVRKDAGKIIRMLGRYPVQLALTTNGVFIDRFIDDFKAAGLRSVNISLDSLNPEVNQQITRRPHLTTVVKHIELLVSEGFRVKVNMVVMKGINEFEIPDFVNWGKSLPIHIRFIEFMPFDGNGWSANKVFTHQQILELLSDKLTFDKLQDEPHDTARAYQVRGYNGTFAVISTMSQPFCETCNRIRLTADGKFKNCLFSQTETDLLTPLRKGDPIETLIKEAILSKHARLGGQLADDYFETDASNLHNRSMITIGG
jgi:cyclic pyranopterin phosphate synthase